MWSVRPGHEHNFVEGRTHVHHVHLYNSVTGGEHNIEILLGCPACPSCKRPYLQTGIQDIDPAREVNRSIETLMDNHRNLLRYASEFGHPIKVGPLAHEVPSGHRITDHGLFRMLHAPRAK